MSKRIKDAMKQLLAEDALDGGPGSGPNPSGGHSAEMAEAIKAPAHASKFDTGGPHGGGSISYYQSNLPHNEAHKNLSGAGFQKESSKGSTERTKLGRSTAYSSSKVQNSSYSHPEGHSATLKTKTDKYGENAGKPGSHVNVYLKGSS